MKKLIVLTLVCFGLISGFNVQSADAKITTESTKVSFTMTEETKGFSMADYNNCIITPLSCGTSSLYSMQKAVL